MPKIQVTEKDLSWYYRQRDPSALTVYMPILASQGPEEPTLCDITNFKNLYGSRGTGLVGDISYDMAASFIEAGLNVLVHRVIPANAEYAKIEVIEDKVTVVSKTPGTNGNGYKIKGTKVDGTSYKFFLKNNYGVVSIIVVDFADVQSPNYYTLVNQTSDLVEFEVEAGVTISASDDLIETISTDYTSLSGGTDYPTGSEANPTAVLGSIAEAIATEGFFDDLKDPYQYTFDIACDGGFNDLTSEGSTTLSAVDNSFKDLVNTTKDAIYLVSGVPGMAPETFLTYCASFGISYAAAYGPWGYAQLLNNGSTTLLPGYYALLIAWANSIAAGTPVWMAPAGIKRARLNGFYNKPEYEVGQLTLNTWQNQEDISSDLGYKINPIMKLKQYGYCIYGNSTLLKGGTDTTSMLQSFSVRVLANQIKKQAFDISLSLQFDQLTPDLFVQFKTLLGVYMDQLRYSGALYDYEITADYSLLTDTQLNTKTVPVTIRISPNPTAENFEIALEISQAGVSFSADSDTETETA